MATIDIVFTWTQDDLQLQGVHYPSQVKDVCAIFVHGMSGNFVDNYFGHVLGETLQQQNIGFIFTHNRGYGHMNDIASHKDKGPGHYDYQRIGVMYERFEDCLKDVDAWMQKARELGYKRFILVGHSLGAPKVNHYFYKYHPKDIVGMVLASPGDMVGLAKKPEYQPNYVELIEEAKKNVAEGNPRKLLSLKLWDWYELSSQTFLDFFEENCPADVLPVLRNPDVFPELAAIDVPILCIVGERDDITIRTLPEDMELLKQKATGCPSFTTHLLPDAVHTYEGQEQPFADVIAGWIKKLS